MHEFRQIDLENMEVFIDKINDEKYYFMATVLDAEYEIRTPALSSLDEVLSHAGECDNDSILEINNGKVNPIYKWSSRRDVWQLVN